MDTTTHSSAFLLDAPVAQDGAAVVQLDGEDLAVAAPHLAKRQLVARQLHERNRHAGFQDDAHCRAVLNLRRNTKRGRYG